MPSDQHLTPDGDSLKITDSFSAERSTAFRVTLKDIEDAIDATHYLVAGEAVALAGLRPTGPENNLTLALVTLKNGFVIVGMSAPVSYENFDAEKGRRFAYENAIRQAWPLFAYAHLDKLYVV